MSLNKLTETQKGLDIGLKIGADELKCNTLEATTINIDELTITTLNTTNVNATNIEATTELKVGTLIYPNSETGGVEFQYPTSDGAGNLTMLRSLPSLSYGFVRSNSVGGSVPLSSYISFTEPDTNANSSSLPSQFYTEDPKGVNIVKSGLYRVVGTLRCIKGTADPSFYCAILTNSSHTQTHATNRGTTLVNTDCYFSLTSYITCVAGEKLSIGVSGTTGGNVVFEYWRLDLEFIQ